MQGKLFTLLSFCLVAVSLGLFIIAASTSEWKIHSAGSSSPFFVCSNGNGCAAIKWNDPMLNQVLQATQAFTVLAPIFSALALLSLVGSHTGFKLHTVALASNALAAASGIIAFATWTSEQSGSNGFSYGLQIVAWCLSVIATPLLLIGSKYAAPTPAPANVLGLSYLAVGAVAFAFFVTATATAAWQVDPDHVRQDGPFSSCSVKTVSSVMRLFCNTNPTADVNDITRTIQAFTVMASVSSGLALVLMVTFLASEKALVGILSVFSTFASGAFGIVSFAVFLGNHAENIKGGYSLGLLIAAWVLAVVLTPIAHQAVKSKSSSTQVASIIATILNFTAWIFFIVAAASSTWMLGPNSISAGPFRQCDGSSCKYYGPDSDPTGMATQAFTAASPVASGFALILSVYSFVNTQVVYRTGSAALSAAAATFGLLAFGLTLNETLNIYFGGIALTLQIIAWVISWPAAFITYLTSRAV